MPSYRVTEAAELLGVSDDTLRRWIEGGRVAAGVDDVGRTIVEGTALAELAQGLAAEREQPRERRVVGQSARNRFTGLVTRVVRDTVMAQVEIQAGPHRITSLISREAADELGLEPGVLAVATVKATTVGIETAQ